MSSEYDLPDHFDDKTIIDAFKSSFLDDSSLWPFNQNEDRTLMVDPESRKTVPMICGLLLRLRTSMFRVAKRSRMREVSPEDTYEHRLFRLMRCFLSKESEKDLLTNWNLETLSMAGTEIARKAVFLSARLQKDFNDQPLLPLNKGMDTADTEMIMSVITEMIERCDHNCNENLYDNYNYYYIDYCELIR